ncbi:MAG: MBL fold metallo-hydrolase [Pseudomonadota bacterium]
MGDFSVRFWGVRGSIPVSGPTTLRYGGNTSCVEVRAGAEHVIIDAGTGIRALGASLKTPLSVRMLFSHLHWDHIQGFPFFAPIYNKDASIEMYSGHKAEGSLVTVLEGQMQEPNFPVNLRGLPASLEFKEIHPGAEVLEFGDLGVHTIPLRHPNGAMGMRFEYQGRVFVHITDHEHNDAFADAVVQFCRDADVLSIDTMFTPEDYVGYEGWGHSHWGHAVDICEQAGVRKLVLFHHNPDYDDDTLDGIHAAVVGRFPNTVMAKEGLEIDL